MKRLFLSIIDGYQRWVSPLLGPCCRFEPSCSHYASEVITRYGLLRGLAKSCLRLLKCHPFHPGGFDPVK